MKPLVFHRTRSEPSTVKPEDPCPAWNESRDSSSCAERLGHVNAAHLQALRDAAQIGVTDIDAYRLRMFESAAELDRYLSTLAERVLGTA